MVVRVAEAGRLAFQLRKGEEGISVFDPNEVNPPLTEQEILGSFRPGSVAVVRSLEEVAAQGLTLVPIRGAEPLPRRLQDAHAEIRPGPGMTRAEFKQALKGLE